MSVEGKSALRKLWKLLALIGLVAGFALGIFAHQTGSAALQIAARALEPLGTMWMNSLRVIVLPLVVSLLISGIATMPKERSAGRWGALSLLVFVGFLLLSATFAFCTVLPILAWRPPTEMTLASIAAAPLQQQGPPPSLPEWLSSLMPSNAIQAALNGEILPVAILSALFAFALRHIPEDRRKIVADFFMAIRDATLVIVRWILFFLPFGAFVLAFSFASKTGAASAQAAVYFVLLSCVLLAAFTLIIYPFAVGLGRISLRRFAAAAAPSQTVAVTTRSSLASLPALVEGAEILKLPQEASSFGLPLAVSVFKVNRPLSSITKLLFLAALFSIDLDASRIATFAVTVFLLSFTSPGLPGGGNLSTLPAYLAAGLPLEGVMLFEALDPIPDVFKTAANVTADLAAVAIVARYAEGAVQNPMQSPIEAAAEPAS